MFLLASAYPWTSWPCHSPRDPCFLEMNVHRNQMIREMPFALRLRTHRIDLTWTGACDRGRVLLISIEINICQQTCDIPRPLHWPHWPYPYWFQCSESFDDVAIFDLNNLINLRGPQMQICFEAFGTQTFLDPFACNGAIFLPLRTVNSCFEWLRVESNLFQSHSIFRPSGYPQLHFFSARDLAHAEGHSACSNAVQSLARPSQAKLQELGTTSNSVHGIINSAQLKHKRKIPEIIPNLQSEAWTKVKQIQADSAGRGTSKDSIG